MYKTNNETIGIHLADLIQQNGYKSDRQFAIQFLKTRDNTNDLDPSDIQNMQNRLCQIKKGKKGIQIEDLPILSELLGVSIENILSSGTAHSPISNRVTNYSIAHCDDRKQWEEYVKREDKLILNPDEYGKNVLEYALEANNYEFLKFLMDKEYIWFTSENPADCYLGFGAGTSIERRNPMLTDNLDSWMKYQDDLRFKMISLAIEAKDFDMLDRLHAREVPIFQTVDINGIRRLQDVEFPLTSNVKYMIRSIINSDNTTLSYFFSEFEITPDRSKKAYTYFFPYAGTVLEGLVKKDKQKATRFLEKAISHNKNVIKMLTTAVESCREDLKSYYDSLDSTSRTITTDNPYRQQEINKVIYNYYFPLPANGFITYMANLESGMDGFVTNAVRTNARSKDDNLQFLIDELNQTYEKIMNFDKED